MALFRYLALATCMAGASAVQLSVTPIQKVVTLLSNLQTKIIKDSEAEQKAYDAFVSWCNTGAKDIEYELETAKADIQDLTATIGKAASDIETQGSKIDDLSKAISSNDADLKAATEIRAKEHGEFVETEKELVDAVDTLERAVNVLQRKMHGSSMLQAQVNRKDIDELINTLTVVVDAASLSLKDKSRLLGLVQKSESSDNEEDTLGAPAPEAYKTHGESIIDVLEDLKQKATSQLDEARREEMNTQHNFELMKQSLQDQIKFDTKSLEESKSTRSSVSETKANAEGALQKTQAALEDSEKVLKNMKVDCMTQAQNHESTIKQRQEELTAIAAAKKALMDMTGAANNLVYNGLFFLQASSADMAGSGLRTRADLVNFEVVNLVRKMARDDKSAALAQLAGRIDMAMRAGGVARAADPFVKVKELITEMIDRLMKEAGHEAQHKAYCDKEFKETAQKLDELKFDIEKATSKIDKNSATSVNLKDEVAMLQSELAAMMKRQVEADALRKEEHSTYIVSKSDLEQGLEGIRTALKILRDYYATALLQQPAMPEGHEKAAGAGTSIIGMLEVVESDLTRSIATIESTEEQAASAYERFSMDNRVSKVVKEKDIEYKTKEAANLDRAVSEESSDRDSLQVELDAVLQYSSNIRGMCELKPESYEERANRRTQEIEGLRQALQILDGASVLLQRQVGKVHTHLRGNM